MIGIAGGIKVNVGIATGNARGLHRGVLLLLSQFLAAVIDLLSDQVALLHPPFRPVRCTHSSKPPVAIQHLDTFGISYQTCFVVDRRDLVAQDGLWGRNVSDLLRPTASPTASQQHNGEQE